MATTTPKAQLPYPEATDPNNVPADMQALATRLDAIPGVETLTNAQRNALAAGQKWDGRVIWNSDLKEHQGWNATTGQWQSIGGGGGWSRSFLLMGA